MELTPAEQAAARQWRDQCRAQLAQLPEPDLVLLPFVNHVRHECAAFAGQSVSFHFREVYRASPGCWVCPATGEVLGEDEALARGACRVAHGHDVPLVHVPDGRWGFIYREGRCPDCGLSARSAESRLVDARERPPIGRTASGTRAGGPPAAHPGQGG